MQSQDQMKSGAVVKLEFGYWEANEERIKEWVEDRVLNQNMGERPEWDQFYEEFPWKYDEQPTFGFMVDEMLDFLDADITTLFEIRIQARFKSLVDEVMEEIEDQIAEQGEQEQEYPRDVI